MPKIYSNNPFYPEETGAFRHELKLLCSAQDLAIVRARLKNLLPFDTYAGENGQYTIRSLYFDDYNNSCLRENEAGVDNRRKYRIRLYNGSPDRLQLEIKRKRHGMTQKLSCRLTREQCETLMRGRCPPYLPPLDPRLREEYWGVSDARPRAERREAEAALAPTEEEREAARKQAPLRELCLAMKTRLMRPVVIVEYQRTAYTYAPGNVRITLDENIGASARIDRFLDPEISLRPILPAGQHVLEVKYDEFLPDALARTLQLGRLRIATFSKYALCRQQAPIPLTQWKAGN